jgi:hypothetical protein
MRVCHRTMQCQQPDVQRNGAQQFFGRSPALGTHVSAAPLLATVTLFAPDPGRPAEAHRNAGANRPAVARSRLITCSAKHRGLFVWHQREIEGAGSEARMFRLLVYHLWTSRKSVQRSIFFTADWVYATQAHLTPESLSTTCPSCFRWNH